ncbi:MAG: carbohydrate kinase family protein [Candidatus Odinarchaeia archaeon]
MSGEDFWPYIVFLPKDRDKQEEFLTTTFGSKIPIKILELFASKNKRTQSEIIDQLKAHSNKSVITHLGNLVNSGILTCRVKRETREGRKTWVKVYSPSKVGEYLITLLFCEREDITKISKLLKELFRAYFDKILQLGSMYNVTPNELRDIVEESIKHVREAPEVVVFGSAALDTYGYVKKFPQEDECILVENVQIQPGGSAANVAYTLATIGVKTSFVTKIGKDIAGLKVLKYLKNSGVETRFIKVDNTRSTIQTFIIVANGQKRVFILKTPNSALSIEKDEVNWEHIRRCKLIYIGETFLEVAEKAARIGKELNKIIIYRPSHPILNMGVNRLTPILSNTDIFLINKVGWNLLRDTSTTRDPKDLLKTGVKNVIITEGHKGVRIYSEHGEQHIPRVSFKFKNTTKAGDIFSAFLMKHLLTGEKLDNAANLASKDAAEKLKTMQPTFT